MKKILETKRLYLRQFSVDDAENMYNLNIDPTVIALTGDVPFESIAASENFIKNYDHYANYGFGRWAVIRKVENDFIGWCGIKFTESNNEYDIGFRFFRAHWNKGFATESAKACMDYAFKELGIKEIVGRAKVKNQASIKVLEKIGFKDPQPYNFDGDDGVIYRLGKNV